MPSAAARRVEGARRDLWHLEVHRGTTNVGTEARAVWVIGNVALPERERWRVVPASTGVRPTPEVAAVVADLSSLGPAEVDELKAWSFESAQPPVLLLGQGDAAEAAEWLERGAADYVSSPASARELVARLKRSIAWAEKVRRLEAEARTDALTGLANYRALTERLAQELARASRYGHPLSVAIIDLDRLKAINDSFGHEVGNQAIAVVADALKDTLRESDFAARFGGDEFVVVLPYQSPQEAGVFAQRLCALVARRPVWPNEDHALNLTVSIGVAGHVHGQPLATVDELLRGADLALYEAKRRGRGRVEQFDWEPASQSA